MAIALQEVDRVEILTLQDNYVDVVAFDDTDVVKRAMPIKDGEFKNSILAEHGFSAVVTVTADGASRSLLFDFGFSPQGAASNAEALGLDLSDIETMVLSHGHMDHFGGLPALVEKIGKKGIELVVHPKAFRKPRYLKVSETVKIGLPALTKEKLDEAQVALIESEKPQPLLGGRLLFLGEIPKRTAFEKGFPRMFYDEDGQSKWDPIEDDTAVAVHLKGKGLVVLSGCAHSGIINTLKYAREVTGVDKLYAVMGGFHLTGAVFDPVIEPTTEALKELDPTYIIPTHCTGRKAVMHLEKEMPEKFLLNMSGTKMVFTA